MPKKNIGSRAEVMHDTASKTAGNLTKSDLKKNKYGKIVSKKASNLAKKNKNLGNFLAKSNSEFKLNAKKGTKEYNKIKNSNKKSKKSMKKSKKSKKTGSKWVNFKKKSIKQTDANELD